MKQSWRQHLLVWCQLFLTLCAVGGVLLSVVRFWLLSEFVSKAEAATYITDSELDKISEKLDRIEERVDNILLKMRK